MKASKPSPVGRATIIGLGGIGRQVALQLATLGVPRLQLVDAGVVIRRTQLREGYACDDTGRPKVHAAAQACHQLNPKLEIHALRRRSLRGLDLGDALLLCPGSAAVLRALPRRTDDPSMIVACCTVGSATAPRASQG